MFSKADQHETSDILGSGLYQRFGMCEVLGPRFLARGWGPLSLANKSQMLC